MDKVICIFLTTLVFLTSSSFSFAQQLTAIEEQDFLTPARGFIDLLAKENFLEAVKNFDAQMQESLPPEQLREAWKSLVAQYGYFKKQSSIRTERFQQYQVVFVTCEFEKLAVDAKIVFNSTKLIAGLSFVPTKSTVDNQPPENIKSDSFQEIEVTVGNGEWSLPGILTLPARNGIFPAVVFVHGSGPGDRDETVGANKPFRDLAQGLAKKGIASLRYDKRTKVYAGRLASFKDNITVKEEVIDDALAAISLLRNREEIDAKKIYVLGHSLGGMLIPRIGMLDLDIAGLIIMAGSTRPLEDVYLDQVSYIFSLDGIISKSEEEQLEQIKKQVACVKDSKLSSATPVTDLPLGIPSKYWLDLKSYYPTEIARRLKQPILILQGGRDYQVNEEDFQGWKKALSSRENVQFKIYPTLNHLFIEGKGKSAPDEYLVAGHVADAVIDDVANWIKKR